MVRLSSLGQGQGSACCAQAMLRWGPGRDETPCPVPPCSQPGTPLPPGCLWPMLRPKRIAAACWYVGQKAAAEDQLRGCGTRPCLQKPSLRCQRAGWACPSHAGGKHVPGTWCKPALHTARALAAALTEEQRFGNVTEKLCKSQERPEWAREPVISIRGSGAPCHFPFGSEERPRTR